MERFSISCLIPSEDVNLEVIRLGMVEYPVATFDRFNDCIMQRIRRYRRNLEATGTEKRGEEEGDERQAEEGHMKSNMERVTSNGAEGNAGTEEGERNTITGCYDFSISDVDNAMWSSGFHSAIENIQKMTVEELRSILINVMVKIKFSITHNDYKLASTIVCDVIRLMANIFALDIELKPRPQMIRLYYNHGYEYDNYYGFINTSNPIYQSIRGWNKVKLSPESFEPLAGLWSMKDGENLACELDRITEDTRMKELYNLRYASSKTPSTFCGWKKEELVDAIKSAFDNQRPRLSLITGNPEHDGIELPGFGSGINHFGYSQPNYYESDNAHMYYPIVYYTLVYRRTFNTIKYASAYMCDLELSPNQIKMLSIIFGDGKYASCDSLREKIQKKLPLTQEGVDIFSSLYDACMEEPLQLGIMETLPEPKVVSLLRIDTMPRIKAWLPLIDVPSCSIRINEKTREFLSRNGVSTEEIDAARKDGISKVEELYNNTVKGLYLKYIDGLSQSHGFSMVRTIDDLRDTASSMAKRKNLLFIVAKFRGNPADYATLNNDSIENHLIRNVGVVGIMMDDKMEISPAYPTFREIMEMEPPVISQTPVTWNSVVPSPHGLTISGTFPNQINWSAFGLNIKK